MLRTASSARIAVMAHGSGSTAGFVERAFGEPLAEEGWQLEALDDRTGSVRVVEHALEQSVRDARVGLVGGVSLGAHAVALWAASPAGQASGVEGLLLVLPAWTGPPGSVAALSSLAAEGIERDGVQAALRGLDHGSWVAQELVRAWPTYGSGLVAALRATAASEGPTLADLAAIEVPVGLVGFVGDPFHPVQVARAWCAALPRAVLVELDQDAPAIDRATIGRAAVAAFETARAGP